MRGGVGSSCSFLMAIQVRFGGIHGYVAVSISISLPQPLLFCQYGCLGTTPNRNLRGFKAAET